MTIQQFHKSSDVGVSQWNKCDTTWMLCLFGTAIGAGVLFLPINAGAGGLYPLIIVSALAFPVTFYSHRGLARFISSTTRPEQGITGAVTEHFGHVAAKAFNLLYFIAIFTILLMYAVAVTNTAESIIIHKLDIIEPERSLLSLALVVALLMTVRFGQEVTVKIMSYLVYPFIFFLIALSVWLIPSWDLQVFTASASAPVSGKEILMSLWLVFPVLILSFNHYPIISPFVVDIRKRYGEHVADKKCKKIQRNSYIMMVTVVLFFVISCAFCLTPQQLAEAKSQNISILTYLANHFNTPVMAWVAPCIAFIAIIKSFLGHYIGAHEAAVNILSEMDTGRRHTINKKSIDRAIFFIILISCWYTAYKNPSILGIIEVISGPAGAIILLLLPMYAIYKIPSLQRYRGKFSNVFVIITGFITVSALLYGLIG